ncbi:rb146 [Thalassobium sp. R2A62]|nr:rb146 [Thalassobium sp. R2A62]
MENIMLRPLTVLCSFVLMTACAAVPRGAGLQSEVLAVDDSAPEAALPEFAVEVVTRDNLVTFLRWPKVSDEHYNWISRTDQPNNRMIRPGDTLTATIWSTENDGLLTGPGQRFITLPDNLVSSSGLIFLPYIGNVKVSGMSLERARSLIEEAYSAALPAVQVQLQMAEGREQAVSLVGGVSSPGTFLLHDSDLTILQLIADGGGISAALSNPQVRLHRNGTIYGVSAARLLATPHLDTILRGGDKVIVLNEARTFLSLGAAGSEAVHNFPTDAVTALEALSLIGGVSDTRANAQGILILRRYPLSKVTADRFGPDHPRTVFTLDLTSADGLFSADQFLIQPGDLIYVTESPMTAAQSIFSLMGSVLRLSNALN